MRTTIWCPGLNREIHENSETCPSCRAGKITKTQIPLKEVNRLELLIEPNQGTQ